MKTHLSGLVITYHIRADVKSRTRAAVVRDQPDNLLWIINAARMDGPTDGQGSINISRTDIACLLITPSTWVSRS